MKWHAATIYFAGGGSLELGRVSESDKQELLRALCAPRGEIYVHAEGLVESYIHTGRVAGICFTERSDL